MDDKKDIGKAFKERLEALQVSPNDLVWDNIVAELDKKEKKKRIIPLWFKAAGIAVVLFAVGGLLLLSKENRNTNNVVTVDEHHNITNKLDSLTIKASGSIKNKDLLVSEDNDKLLLGKKINDIKMQTSTNNKVVDEKKLKSNYFITKNSVNQIQISKNKKKKEVLIVNNSVKENINIENSINNKGYKKTTKLLKFTFAKLPLLKDKLDINLVKSENKLKINKKRSIALAIKGSPIFYSTISNGSSIDKIFDGNGKTSDITTSYGLQTSLKISNKLSFRIGLSKVDLAYNTKKATEKTIINAKTIDLKFSRYNENAQAFTEAPFGNIFEFKQQVNYLEIPLEVSYQLVDKKIKIDVISGISTLLLNDNRITVNNQVIGKANNLNKLSYTGNLGLGFNYELSAHLNLNIEPIYKLQFSTYSNNVNYKPYYFGVYSGLSFKF